MTASPPQLAAMATAWSFSDKASWVRVRLARYTTTSMSCTCEMERERSVNEWGVGGAKWERKGG